MPVHPSGRYRFNTLVQILKHDLQISTSLGLINRLDRLTSGICILSVDGANKQLHKDMVNKCFQKEYLARVSGHFPAGKVVCDKPLRLLDHKLGVVVVDEEAGKEASTTFEVIRSLGEDQSLVRCVPSTGRTHQIRVHLLHLGCPIANDPLYSHPCWRDPAAAGGIEGILETLMRAQLDAEEGAFDPATPTTAAPATPTTAAPATPTTAAPATPTTAAPATAAATGHVSSDGSSAKSVDRDTDHRVMFSGAPTDDKDTKPITEPVPETTVAAAKDPRASSPVPLCADCARGAPLPDPPPGQLSLFLHAHRYSCAEWTFTARPPAWTYT
jgi:hypothetical protein